MKNFLDAFHSLVSLGGALSHQLLAFIFPPKGTSRLLSQLTATEFAERASRARDTEKDSLAFFDYRDPLVRQAVWEMKYRGNGAVIKLVAEVLWNELGELLADESVFSNFTNPLLIPIPISKKRLRNRGFNQCVRLATAMATLDRGQFFEIETAVFSKIRDTIPQTKLSARNKRLKNLVGTFEVKNAAKINGRCIILLDDVYTTGATLREAKKTLLSAGAERVLAVAFAH